MLSVEGLCKRFGDRAAVDGLSLRAEAGQILGLLGPNGAGKSTTLNIISGLLTPDAGSVRIGGASLANGELAFKRRLGLVPQDIALHEELSAHANLRLFGSLYGVSGNVLRERSEAALALVGLADRAADKVADFSGGMKRRLNIACSLVHEPDVLLLDEPTAGVDPQSRNAIFDNLEELKRRGKAIVYTTHYMEEVERLADHITIIDHGKVMASGTLPMLLQRLPGHQKLILDVEGTFRLEALSREPYVRRADYTAPTLAVVTDDLAAAAPPLLQWLSSEGVKVTRMASEQATLEDVFLSLTGRQLRD